MPIRYVIDKPGEYYIAIKDTGFMKIDAVPIKLKELPGVDLFFHADYSGFGCKISHGLTGLAFPGYHESKRETMQGARDCLNRSKHPFDKVVKKGLLLLKKWNRGDYSPRYRKEGGK